MPASEAQIAENRRNDGLSTGPRSPEGKENSRRNALKHGRAGAGVALTNEDAAEVERVFGDLEAELRPSGAMGRLLVRRIATNAVRMERCVLLMREAAVGGWDTGLFWLPLPKGRGEADGSGCRDWLGHPARPRTGDEKVPDRW